MKPHTFEEALRLYEKMIKNQMKKLSLYRDYDEYYQCGIIALWRAYMQFEEGKGDFSAYAMRTVRGYLLVRLNKENKLQSRSAAWNPEYMEGIALDDKEEDFEVYMDLLDERRSYVLRECFQGGKKLTGIARELGITYDQARYLYRSALAILKKRT
ncbi:MAG: sigma-70 family RNA polymerase sigma factor [Ectobacillus sp.]